MARYDLPTLIRTLRPAVLPAVLTAFVYFVWRMWLVFLASIAPRFLDPHVQFMANQNYGVFLPRLVSVWGNFDGVIFLKIAAEGYGIEQVPFFPLLPIMIAGLHDIFNTPILIAGLILSTVFFLGAFGVLYLLLRKDGQKNWWLFLAILFTFPTAFFFTAVYQDALFLFLASCTLLFGRKKWWLLAGLTAGLATLSRLNGLALFFFLFVEYFLSFAENGNTWSPKEWLKTLTAFRKRSKLLDVRDTLPFFLAPFAFLTFLGFIQFKFGSWHLFFDGVQVWHREHLVLPPQTLWRYFKILILNAKPSLAYWVAWGEAFFTGLYVLAIGWSWKKIRPSYWVFMLLHLSIPLVTGTLQGMPRYGLHLYPLFLVLLIWVQKMPTWQKIIYFAVMLLLQAAYLIAFVQGYFVS